MFVVVELRSPALQCVRSPSFLFWGAVGVGFGWVGWPPSCFLRLCFVSLGFPSEEHWHVVWLVRFMSPTILDSSVSSHQLLPPLPAPADIYFFSGEYPLHCDSYLLPVPFAFSAGSSSILCAFCTQLASGCLEGGLSSLPHFSPF